MRRVRCSPIWRSQSPMVQTRSVGLRCWPTARLFGPVASTPTAWRALDRIDAVRLPALRAARGHARKRAWDAGAGPDLVGGDGGLIADIDSTITIAHSDKENAAATWKKSYGFHPLLCFLDRPTSPVERRWPGCWTGQRRQQHRRPCRGAGGGAGGTAGDCPAAAR